MFPFSFFSGEHDTFSSSPVRHDFRSCNHDYPANDLGHGEVSRYAEQCTRVYEITRGAESFERTCYGLCCINVGNDKGIRY